MTDHKAEAERAISGIHDWQQREGETDASLLSVALEAQASATLYLAEQQRIANLIALHETQFTSGEKFKEIEELLNR